MTFDVMHYKRRAEFCVDVKNMKFLFARIKKNISVKNVGIALIAAFC
jgi:hypothetical protein